MLLDNVASMRMPLLVKNYRFAWRLWFVKISACTIVKSTF